MCMPTYTIHICAVIWNLIVIYFTDPKFIVNRSNLFEGSNQYSRNAKLFMALGKDNMDELKTMRVGEGGLGKNPVGRVWPSWLEQAALCLLQFF